jgi:hypothetical protein
MTTKERLVDILVKYYGYGLIEEPGSPVALSGGHLGVDQGAAQSPYR